MKETGAALTVQVHSARGLPKMDLVGHIDPYVKVEALGQTAQTEVKPNEPAPLWDEVLTLDVSPGTPGSLRVSLWDHDRFTPDDRVGEVVLDLEALSQSPQPWTWMKVGKKGGEVLISAGFGRSYALMKQRLSEREGVRHDDQARTLYLPMRTIEPEAQLALKWSSEPREGTLPGLTVHLLRTMRCRLEAALWFEGCEQSWSQFWEEEIQYGPLKVFEDAWQEGDLYGGVEDALLVSGVLNLEGEGQTTLRELLAARGYTSRSAPTSEALSGLEGVQEEEGVFRLAGSGYAYDIDPDGERGGLYRESSAVFYRQAYSGAGYHQTRASTVRVQANGVEGWRQRLVEAPARPRPSAVELWAYPIKTRASQRLSKVLPELWE